MKNTIDLFPTLESKKINEVESNDSQLNKKNNLKTGALSNLSTKHKIDIFSSETISQYIVEKLISYTFYELKKNEHEGKIGQFCYNFFENFNLLEHQTENIFYDRDDFYQDDSGNDLDQLNKLPFEFIYEGENSWNISRPPVRKYKFRNLLR